MEGRAQVPFNLWIGLSLKDRRSQSPSSFPRKPGSRGGRSPLLPAHGGALWAVCGPALRDLGCRKPPARRAPLFPLPSRQSCPQEPRLRATRSPGCGSHPCRFSRLGRSTYLSPSTAVGFLFLATNATFGKAFHELLNKDSRPEEALRPGERTRRSSLRAGGEHAQTGRLLCACAQSHRCLPGARCPAARTCLLKALHLGPWGKAKPLLKGCLVLLWLRTPALRAPSRLGLEPDLPLASWLHRGRWLHLSGRFLIYKQGALTVPAAQGLGESHGLTQVKNTEGRLANGRVQ